MSKRKSTPAQVPSVVAGDITPNDVMLQSAREFLREKRTGRYMKISLKDGAGANTIEMEISDPK